MKYLIVAQETSEILAKTSILEKAHRLAKSWHNCRKFNGNKIPIQIRENINDSDYAIAEYSSGEFSFGTI